MEYPKTENLYAADPERPGVRGPKYGFKLPAFSQISRWLVTEKVDGMNMRVIWTPELTGDQQLFFFGRTDRANIPGDLLRHMQETFTVEKMTTAFAYAVDAADGPAEMALPESVVLFGEGFGPGIQKAGAAYGGEKRFILFDVLVDGQWWLRWDDVVDVATKLGIPTVPVLARDADLDVVENIVRGAWSDLLPNGSEHVEGIVARTDPYLFDGRGRRVMFKHKVRDLTRAAAA